MTCVGSVAWTAPEVLRHESYDKAVDVYSYGIVLWELMARAEPYFGMGQIEVAIAVAQQSLRPKLDRSWPSEWLRLIRWCWTEVPRERPTFGEILEFIAQRF